MKHHPLLIALLVFAGGPCALNVVAGGEASLNDLADGPPPPKELHEELTLEEIDQKLNNPMTSLWSMTLQYNYSVLEGDAIGGSETTSTTFFQPALPLPVGRDMVFIARPVIPYVTSPVFDSTAPGGTNGTQSGLGDIQLISMLGPNLEDGNVWGAGATFKFPTAGHEALGSGKWQAGPAFMFFHLGNKWTTGVLAQHWWSYAGDSDRAKTNRTDIQYVARMKLPAAMSIGMGPTISIDWTAESGNRITVPIGLGITKTILIGKTPFKIRFEPQYSIIKPDSIGTAWNFRFQVTPVIPSPFKAN